MKENQIRRQLISDFNQFARRMRLQYIYHDQNIDQHPFQVKSSWIPPILRSVALETYLEEVKIKLAETPLVKPKNNLPPGEQRALKENGSHCFCSQLINVAELTKPLKSLE